jgi:hypothetical protein
MNYCYAASSGDLDPDLLGVECHVVGRFHAVHGADDRSVELFLNHAAVDAAARHLVHCRIAGKRPYRLLTK